MARLSQQALEQYRQQGFLRGGKILSDRELARLREEIDRLIAELPAGIRPENMPSVHYRHRYFLDLFLSQPLVDIAEQILGPDVALFTSYVISKRPGDGLAVEWHQDAAFFPIDPMETFTVWLAVDDSDRENGCMRVIPGSHRNKALLNHRVDMDHQTTLPLSFPEVDQSEAVDVELEAGEFSAHDVYLVARLQPQPFPTAPLRHHHQVHSDPRPHRSHLRVSHRVRLVGSEVVSGSGPSG